MLDRTIAPKGVKLDDKFDIPTAQTKQFKNGVFLHTLLSGHQEAIRLEFIFEGGNWNQQQPGASYFTTKLLSSGTKSYSSKEIEQLLALSGAFLELESNNDKNTITLYILSKHLESLLPLLLEIITLPTFPETELNNLKQITQQSLSVNLNKTSYLASTKFKEVLYGSEHPYGRNFTQNVIEEVDRTHLVSYFTNTFSSNNCNIILSGNTGQYKIIELLESYFGSSSWGTNLSRETIDFEHNYIPQNLLIEKVESIQSSIRIGMPLFNITHQDYIETSILVEVFGGYFGSRLMKNIREDKGYTYGISASLVSMKNGGYFVVGTDVDVAYTKDTIAQVLLEMKKLKEEIISEEELELVKQYLIGSFLNSINTPFALADRFKSIYFYLLPIDFYSIYLQKIENVTAEQLRVLAKKYFVEDLLSYVVAGAKA
ncbi:MAG: insulinase family protein [Cytophagales bacterium]|nr:MAG: insulinase family protein [Cytophagales bacterium]